MAASRSNTGLWVGTSMGHERFPPSLLLAAGQHGLWHKLKQPLGTQDIITPNPPSAEQLFSSPLHKSLEGQEQHNASSNSLILFLQERRGNGNPHLGPSCQLGCL